MSAIDFRELNEAFFEQLATPGMEKNAQDYASDFVRTRVREESFYQKIMPPVDITYSDLDPAIDTDQPLIICEKEPDSPAAVTIPFADMPTGWYVRGPKFMVTFDRIVTPRNIKDLAELRTYKMDIREIISDNEVKDMLSELDGKFLTAVNTALIGAGSTVPHSGVVQWQTIFGGIDRDTLEEAFKIMPKTPFHLEANTVLCNNVTIREVLKWGRDEVGGDLSEDLLVNGWTERKFMNANWIVTIKRNLVPDDSMYFFGDTRFIGKSFNFEPTTLYIDRVAYMIEWFSYMSTGGALAHVGALARSDFS